MGLAAIRQPNLITIAPDGAAEECAEPAEMAGQGR